jgi:hypothetical protein
MTSANQLPLPPGNLGLPILGETPAFLTDGKFQQKRLDKYGSVFKTANSNLKCNRF